MQIASITTNEQGEYEYTTEEDYPEQTLDFIIQKEGFERKNFSYEIDKAQIKSDILLNELEKETKEKTRIFGTIRNSNKRDPVKNASITLSIEGTQIATITSDELGGYEYTAEEDYTGQTLDFVIQKEGFIRKDISHEIDRFEIESDFLMDEIEIKIKGKICDETDSPLDNASIGFSIGNSTIDLVSDKDGSFSFTVGQQFLNQSIGYEVNKEGFKIKSGKLKLLENLKCINISKSISPIVPDKSWIKIAVVGIILTSLVIYLFALPGVPDLSTNPDPMDFDFEPETSAQTFSIWNDGDETLEWNVSSDRDWIMVSNDSGTDSDMVSVTVNSAGMDPGSYTGRITVESNGGTKTGRISLYIPEHNVPSKPSLEPPRIHYFRADPKQIDGPEGETILSWKVTDATSATIDGIGSVEVLEGSIERWVEQTTTFILRATNDAGILDVKIVTVTVEGETEDLPRIDTFIADPDSISAGENSTLSWKVSGATSVTIEGRGRVNSVGEMVVDPDETTIYFLRATNEAGISDVKTVTVNVGVEPVELPIIHFFTADDDSISTGENSTLSWKVSGAISVTIDGKVVDPDGGKIVVNPDETFTYELIATNEAGKADSTVIVTVEISYTFGDVVKSFSAPEGTQPNGLAWDGSNLWMSSYSNEGGIYKLNPMNGSVLDKYRPSAAKFNGYSGLTYDGTYLLEADGYGSGIYKLNTSDCSIISTIPSPDKGPGDLAWDGSYLWIYGRSSKKIYKVSPADGSVVDSYTPPGGGWGSGLTYDDSHLWLSTMLSTHSKIYKIDPSDFSVIDSFIAPCSRPDGLAWDGEYLWCASFNEGMIYQIYIGAG